ncbi:MAG: hypothetical protein Q7S06_00860 [Nanoarchaeota archaeon]|nr:hypothetical protein [Nanoarchaeota archaeon]
MTRKSTQFICTGGLYDYFNGLSSKQLEEVRKAHNLFLDKLSQVDDPKKYTSYRIREGLRRDSLTRVLARDAVHLMFNQYLKLPED